MTVQGRARTRVRRVIDRVLQPVVDRVAAVEHRQGELSARVEQLTQANGRLAAHLDRAREEIRAEFDPVIASAEGAHAVVVELVQPGDERLAGDALSARFDHALRHAEAKVLDLSRTIDRQLAEIRSSTRLTQALVDRLLTEGPAAADLPIGEVGTAPTTGDQAAVPGGAGPVPVPQARFEHTTPRFDLLYRTFEDRHRGSAAEVRDRQEGDYLDLLSGLPSPELAIADLGCGRGELVQLLQGAGQRAVGVDANTGQLVDESAGDFVEADLFEWLDQQPDDSLRAVVAMHVVEHLPLDLQVRLVFEAHRTVAPGGVMVLETPNTLSLSVGATNFWVDPTHERPVHPLFLEFLAEQAGFPDIEVRLLHDVPAKLVGPESVDRLLRDLNSLLLGPGDLALVART